MASQAFVDANKLDRFRSCTILHDTHCIYLANDILFHHHLDWCMHTMYLTCHIQLEFPLRFLPLFSCMFWYKHIDISRIHVFYLIQTLFKGVTSKYFSLDRSCTVTKCIVSTKLGMCGIDCWLCILFRMSGRCNAEGLVHWSIVFEFAVRE